MGLAKIERALTRRGSSPSVGIVNVLWMGAQCSDGVLEDIGNPWYIAEEFLSQRSTLHDQPSLSIFSIPLAVFRSQSFPVKTFSHSVGLHHFLVMTLFLTYEHDSHQPLPILRCRRSSQSRYFARTTGTGSPFLAIQLCSVLLEQG